MNKSILHLDMDAFFASVEQAANPKLRQRPVIVGSRADKQRTVVAACSYEAKLWGVESGMAAGEAFRLCPQAVFVPADCPKYIYTAQKIYKILQGFSPQVEMGSIDEFYLDITGCERIFGSRKNIAYLIKEKLRNHFGITGSIGIAPNKLMAKLTSRMHKPDGLVICKEKDALNRLKHLPVEKIPGVGPKITALLHQISIFTCSQLAATPEPLLVKYLGKSAVWLKQAARGEDPSPPVEFSAEEESPPKSIGHSYTLEKDTGNPDVLQAWIRLLCEMVAARLRNLLLEGSVVCLELKRSNLQSWSKQKKFPAATFDGQYLYQRALIILKSLFPESTGLKVRALGISVSGLQPASPGSLLEEDRKRRNLISVIDRINQRFGPWVIYPAHLASIS